MVDAFKLWPVLALIALVIFSGCAKENITGQAVQSQSVCSLEEHKLIAAERNCDMQDSRCACTGTDQLGVCVKCECTYFRETCS